MSEYIKFSSFGEAQKTSWTPVIKLDKPAAASDYGFAIHCSFSSIKQRHCHHYIWRKILFAVLQPSSFDPISYQEAGHCPRIAGNPAGRVPLDN